jgi:hypothetical protein
MGEVEAICTASRGPGMTDRDILAVIAPPENERLASRAALVREPRMPAHAAQRQSTAIGAILGPQHLLRTNHFKLNPAHLPARYFHYHVHLYKLFPDGSMSDDVSTKEDFRVSVTLLHKLKERHADWAEGFAFDGSSSLFTNAALPFTAKNGKGEPTHSEDIGVPNLDNTESVRKRFRVSLTLVDSVLMPAPGSPEWKNLSAIALRAMDLGIVSFARWMQMENDPNWFLSGQKVFSGSSEPLTLGHVSYPLPINTTWTRYYFVCILHSRRRCMHVAGSTQV